MQSLKKIKSDLDNKFQKVLRTQAGFAFFVAIHGFIKHIELNPSLSESLSRRIKVNRETDIQSKYAHLKQIYQGLEDANRKSNADLGHTRYVMIRDLNRIQNKEVSENNPLWKKRELFRKLAGEVHTRLCAHLLS